MKTWRFPFFSFYDTAGMERYLERMAKRGWMLKHLGNYGWIFESCTPRDIHFAVTYYPKASAFDPELTEGQRTLEEFCGHSGWRLVDSNAKLMAFANDESDPVPIHTEPSTELELLEKVSKQCVGVWSVMLIFAFYLSFMSIQQLRFNPIPLLSSTLSLVNGITMPLLGLVILLDLLIWFRWRKKARLAAEQEEPLPPVRGCAFLLGILLVLFLIGTAWGLLVETRPGVRFGVLLTLLAFVLLHLVVNGVRLFMKKRKASRESNRAVTLIVDVVMAVLLAAAMLCPIGQYHSAGWNPADDTLILTAEELAGIPQPGATRKSSHESSFLAAHTQGWDMGDGDLPRENCVSLSYEVVDTHIPFLYDIFLHELMHRYDHHGDHNEGWDENAPFYVYTPADPAPWGAAAAWQLMAYGEPADTYLICWDGRMLELETSWELSGSQMELAAARFSPNR